MLSQLFLVSQLMMKLLVKTFCLSAIIDVMCLNAFSLYRTWMLGEKRFPSRTFPDNLLIRVRPSLTLSYLSEGSLALAVFRHHYLKTVLIWLYLDFLTTSFLYLGVTLFFFLNKSGLKLPFLPWGPCCPLKTILLNDLVGCDSTLQMVMAVFLIWSVPNSHYL